MQRQIVQKIWGAKVECAAEGLYAPKMFAFRTRLCVLFRDSEYGVAMTPYFSKGKRVFVRRSPAGRLCGHAFPRKNATKATFIVG